MAEELMSTTDTREVIVRMTVISLPCSRGVNEHDACPDDVILDLWQMHLICGCECHMDEGS